jgi:hypothetical protein
MHFRFYSTDQCPPFQISFFWSTYFCTAATPYPGKSWLSSFFIAYSIAKCRLPREKSKYYRVVPSTAFGGVVKLRGRGK